MTAAPGAGAREPRLRRWLVGGITVLCLLLPALAAGTGIDAPPQQGELRRVGWALGVSDAESGGEVLRLFYGATIGSGAAAHWPAQAHQIVGQARLASVLAILATTLVLYLALAVSRGRGSALAACVALSVLPPVAREGSLLRPEAPAGLFGLLGVVLCLVYAWAVPRRPGIGELRRAVRLGVIGLYAGIAFGLAAACTPRAGAFLLVPMGAAVLVAALVVVRLPRWVRRFRRGGLPFAAITARLWPWVLLALLALGTTAIVQRVAGAGEPLDVMPHVAAPLLPERTVSRVPLWFLLGIGMVRMLLGVGFRLGRRRRLGLDTLLLLYVGAMLIPHVFRPQVQDALLAAPAVALLASEGALLLVFVVLGLSLRRATRGG